MMLLRQVTLLFACVVLLVCATIAPAQFKLGVEIGLQERRQYVPFPIDKDVEELVKQRLQMDKKLEPFKDLVKQILANPDKFPIDPAKFKDVKFDDPEFKKAVQEWAARDKDLQKALRDWVKKMPPEKLPDVERLQHDLKQILDHPPDPSRRPNDLPRPAPDVKPIERKPDPLAKVTEQAMKRVEAANPWLGESKAWDQALKNLQASLKNQDAGRFGPGDWPSKLGLPDARKLQLSEEMLKRLQDMPRPKIEKWNWEQRLPLVGRIPTPNLAAPALPQFSGPSLPTVGAWVSWLLFVLLFMVAGLWVLRHTRRTAPKVNERAGMGPWPVRPEKVSTRAEFVQAFDYLALWTLGLDVKSWNHVAVAERWSRNSPAHAGIARALASLYESARYTAGADELPADTRDQVRRSLVQLAEAL
jgi:hypothetical protein